LDINISGILQHPKAEHMQHVEALSVEVISRCFAVNNIYAVENSLEKKLCLMQEKDSEIVKIRENLPTSEHL